MVAIKLEKICKQYQMGKTLMSALRDVTLEINVGEIICLMGPSGSGKSTLLNIGGGLDTPDQGSVVVQGTNLLKFTDAGLSEFRNQQLGFIFQAFNLVPVFSTYENIEYPLTLQKIPKQERRIRVKEMLAAVGLEAFQKHKPDELSGGQRQRVAIGRALVTKPKIVIADEPTANLDHNNGNSVMQLMLEMNTRSGTTLIFSTHDTMVASYAHRVIRLWDGQIQKEEINSLGR